MQTRTDVEEARDGIRTTSDGHVDTSIGPRGYTWPVGQGERQHVRERDRKPTACTAADTPPPPRRQRCGLRCGVCSLARARAARRPHACYPPRPAAHCGPRRLVATWFSDVIVFMCSHVVASGSPSRWCARLPAAPAHPRRRIDRLHLPRRSRAGAAGWPEDDRARAGCVFGAWILAADWRCFIVGGWAAPGGPHGPAAENVRRRSLFICDSGSGGAFRTAAAAEQGGGHPHTGTRPRRRRGAPSAEAVGADADVAVTSTSAAPNGASSGCPHCDRHLQAVSAL